MAEIFVAMPVYDGAQTLPEAIRALRRQTFEDFHCRVSVDPGTDDSAAVARAAIGSDPRFTVVEQPERRGWPGNFNGLVRECDRPYFVYWQQDDFASTRYLEVLHAAMRLHPEASVAYTDVQWFGERFDRESLAPVAGGPLTRALQAVEDVNYIPLRGVIRRSALPPDGIETSAARRSGLEFAFVARLAAAGPFLRCDEALYFKRGEAQTAGRAGQRRPETERRREWAAIGEEWLRVLRACAPGEVPDGMLLALVVDRLVAMRPGRGFWVTSPQTVRDARELLLLLAAAGDVDLAEARWFSRGEPTGLERPLSPFVVAALDEERLRRDRLRGTADITLTDRLGHGFHVPEEWGAWTAGTHASIELGGPTIWPGGPVRLRCQVAWPSRVAATVGGEPTWTEARPGAPFDLVVDAPPGTHRIDLHAPDARTPDGADERRLGLAVISIATA